MTFVKLASTVVLFALSPTPKSIDHQPKPSESALSSSVFPMEITTTSEEKYGKLLDWLKSEDGEVNDKIEIKLSDRGGGFGAFVTAPVEENELLFTVPRNACVTLSDAMSDSNCGEAFGSLIKAAGPGGNTVVMAGYLAKEYLLSKEEGTNKNIYDQESSSSPQFGPYLATLPWERGINNQEHVLFWNDDDVEKLLKGSLCYKESTELRSEVQLAIKILNGIIGPSVLAARKSDEDDEGFKWPWQSDVPKVTGIVDGVPEAVKGAFVCLLTRSFQDGSDTENNEKLVPMLDMLQHADEPNVSHAMRKEDGTVEVRAKRAIGAGEELLNQYRAETEETMPYHRFFSRFGFVPGISEPIENLLEDRSSIFYPLKAEV
mmetsp:Transcript_21580/g.30471  ORF Transcript_21580/g.30471 Transcript_21580/m.30471 type:complete len:375 (-) Transcript_21580:1016-2140(-)